MTPEEAAQQLRSYADALRATMGKIPLLLVQAIDAISPVLSWVSAHPEAAKRLAEGTHVVVPKYVTDEMARARWLAPDDCDTQTLWEALLAAATPVPSDEAQGER